MKKLLAILLALVLAAACALSAAADEGSEPDWAAYDALIAQIKETADFVEREALMHQAEDMLMETGCIIPLYYDNDSYLAKDDVQGVYSNLYGMKYFLYATNESGSTLRINLASEPDRLDPALNTTLDGGCLAVNSFAGLYAYDESGALVPNLAESYSVSEDGLTYVFTLKEGLKWSDGSPLTAADFEYSWKRAADPETGAGYSYLFAVIEGYDSGELNATASEDGTTLTVVLSSPCAYMLDLCAFPVFYPVKQEAVESAEGYLDEDGAVLNPGAWASEAGFVSSGAYVLTEWVHGQSMVYTKNPYFWNADSVSIERLEFMLSDDATAIYAAYQAGDLDFTDTIPTDAIESAKDSGEFYVVDQLGVAYVCFNVQSDLFAGKTAEQASAMRRAFSLLIDRQYIIDTVAQTDQQAANTFVPAGTSDGHGGQFRQNDADYTYPDAEATGYYGADVDVEGAIALLESAGYAFDESGMLSAETPISFEYLTNELDSNIAVAECLQQDFAAIGIDMTIRTLDWNVFVDEMLSGNYVAARSSWVADFNDPINFLEMWTSDSGNNFARLGVG